MNGATSFLGTRHPLIQAPMAGAQGHALAIAVSNAGGLGSLPAAVFTLEKLREELELLRAGTALPFNVNFFCHAQPTADAAREARWHHVLTPFYGELGLDAGAIPSGSGRFPFDDDAADLIEEFRPAVVSFHFGLPSDVLLGRVRSTGAKIVSSATTVEEALWLERKGVDAIVAQGLEAGGHRGTFLPSSAPMQLGTFALLPQVCDAVKTPVIAAGGIADARGIRAALDLGASGVQLGTAFLLCPEATTSAVHAAALRERGSRPTALTNLFTGRPARGIVNRLMNELGPMSELPPAFPLATAALGPLRAEAERRGLTDFSLLSAGQNTSVLREIPAAELVRELAKAF